VNSIESLIGMIQNRFVIRVYDVDLGGKQGLWEFSFSVGSGGGSKCVSGMNPLNSGAGNGQIAVFIPYLQRYLCCERQGKKPCTKKSKVLSHKRKRQAELSSACCQ